MNHWGLITTTPGFAPVGTCLYWNPNLITLSIVGHLGFALSCLVIPGQIGWVALRGGLSVPGWAALLLCAFILLTGAEQVIDVVTLFRPIYWIQAAETAVTALIALATATLLPFEVFTRIRTRNRQ